MLHLLLYANPPPCIFYPDNSNVIELFIIWLLNFQFFGYTLSLSPEVLWGQQSISLRLVQARRNQKLTSSASVRPTGAYFSNAFNTLDLDSEANARLVPQGLTSRNGWGHHTCPERCAQWMNCWFDFNKLKKEVHIVQLNVYHLPPTRPDF